MQPLTAKEKEEREKKVIDEINLNTKAFFKYADRNRK